VLYPVSAGGAERISLVDGIGCAICSGMTIETPQVDVDLYTPVMNQISVSVPVELRP